MPEEIPMNKLVAGLALTVLLASGCASIPRPLEGEVIAVAPEESSDHDVGQTVRWGGYIVDTRPGKAETCIEVLSQPLDKRARPLAGDGHQGRFLACRDGFEDPAIFETGRDLTIMGELTGFVEGHIGEFQYIYPRVEARALYLWP